MAWIFLNDAFLSIVDPPTTQDILLVRGRVRGDIERIFPGHEVTETPNRDYRFRAFIPRKTVANAIAKQILGIEYGNFKDSVKEQDRHDAYFGCWAAMHNLQYSRLARERHEQEWDETELPGLMETEAPKRKTGHNRGVTRRPR